VIKGSERRKDVFATTYLIKKTMYLDQAKKAEIFGQFGKDAKDTGSVESQVALFTYRIKHLTEHLKKNHKDYGTARSLTKMVGRRRKLLKYLYNKDINRYRELIKALGLRK
jgi:small subunit ribosomal protein S15